MTPSDCPQCLGSGLRHNGEDIGPCPSCDKVATTSWRGRPMCELHKVDARLAERQRRANA